MTLDITKLQNLKIEHGKTIAACPACKETGHDEDNNHLFIDSSGKFGCIKYPGTSGIDHRKRIFALIGIKDEIKKIIYPSVKEFERKPPEVIIIIKHKKNIIKEEIKEKIFKKPIINCFSEILNQKFIIDIFEEKITFEDGIFYTFLELKKLPENIDKKHLKTCHIFKKKFDGKIA